MSADASLKNKAIDVARVIEEYSIPTVHGHKINAASSTDPPFN